MRMERNIFIAVGAITLVLRYLFGARDPIGFVLHIVMMFYGVHLLPRVEQYGDAARPILRYILLPIAIIVFVLDAFFAIQVLVPFVAALALAAISIPVWVADRTTYTILVVTLSLPILVWCGYAMTHVAEVIALRTLDANEVEAIRFTYVDDARIRTEVRDRVRIVAFCRAMRGLAPYSPNHDRFYTRPRWAAEVLLRGGDRIGLTTGEGTRANPRTAWVELGVPVYESRQLYRVLQTLPRPRNSSAQ